MRTTIDAAARRVIPRALRERWPEDIDR